MLRLFSRNAEEMTTVSLCRRTVVLSCGGPRKSIRENSSLVCQKQRVKIKPNRAFSRTKEMYK